MSVSALSPTRNFAAVFASALFLSPDFRYFILFIPVLHCLCNLTFFSVTYTQNKCLSSSSEANKYFCLPPLPDLKYMQERKMCFDCINWGKRKPSVHVCVCVCVLLIIQAVCMQTGVYVLSLTVCVHTKPANFENHLCKKETWVHTSIFRYVFIKISIYTEMAEQKENFLFIVFQSLVTQLVKHLLCPLVLSLTTYFEFYYSKIFILVVLI